MKVLIAGCGYVGSALAVRLLEQGHEVVGLRRKVAALPDGVAGIEADLLQPATLDGLPGDVTHIVYSVGASERTDAAYRDAYVVGLENLLEAMARRRAPLERVVFTSSTAVYAQSDGSLVDEESPCEPSHFSGQRLLEAESLVHGGQARGIVLRLGGIYGPGRTSLLERVARGQATYASGPPRYTNRIHQTDCARVIEHLLSLEQPHPVYLGVDGDPAEERAVLGWLAEQLGAPEPREEEAGANATGRRATSNKRCTNRRLIESGYEFVYPSYRDGYRALLAERGTPTG